MPGRTATDARRNYIEPLARAIGFVTQASLVMLNTDPAAKSSVLRLGPRAAGGVELAGSTRRLVVGIMQRIRTDRVADAPPNEQFETYSSAYSYSIGEAASGLEILAYHSHPGGSGFERPHIHVSQGAGELLREIRQAHLPTGSVLLQEFLTLLVRDFGVRARPGWERAFERSIRALDGKPSP
jgi:hypothetical protein